MRYSNDDVRQKFARSDVQAGQQERQDYAAGTVGRCSIPIATAATPAIVATVPAIAGTAELGQTVATRDTARATAPLQESSRVPPPVRTPIAADTASPVGAAAGAMRGAAAAAAEG